MTARSAPDIAKDLRVIANEQDRRGNHVYAGRLREAADRLEQQHEALWLAYAAVDELCARPGTCLPIRPRLGGDGE